ncbi:RlpA-like double-psi beta-barrel domain-containing protein [Aneurinibacillus migulanus]|uniref:septal ring lytic transglycosylase RlpA family protein n=1 Tax=Aneurinibacillus migulanus TaxID=47500 RepID=UPI002E1F740E|nr:RlpA-like double-psi beta-barrel domain-containing protein [Aneurinibacillus migulanus]
MNRFKKVLLGCTLVSLAIPSVAGATSSLGSVETSTDHTSTIPAHMAPGTLIEFDDQNQLKILEEGDDSYLKVNSNLVNEGENSDTELPVIKPGMQVVYDALGAPIVIIPESREEVNVEMKEINNLDEHKDSAPVFRAASTESGEISHFDIWKEKKTASGLRAADGAAHKTIGLKKPVNVKNNKNSKTTNVRILDRGPYAKGRILDMSQESFAKVYPLKEGHFPGTITWQE